MTQGQLDRAVAQATGESVRTIRHRGFNIELPVTESHDDPVSPQIIDWDAQDEARIAIFPSGSRSRIPA